MQLKVDSKNRMQLKAEHICFSYMLSNNREPIYP